MPLDPEMIIAVQLSRSCTSVRVFAFSRFSRFSRFRVFAARFRVFAVFAFSRFRIVLPVFAFSRFRAKMPRITKGRDTHISCTVDGEWGWGAWRLGRLGRVGMGDFATEWAGKMMEHVFDFYSSAMGM